MGSAGKPFLATTEDLVRQSPLADAIVPLVKNGYLHYLRPAAPPGVKLQTKRGVRTGDGKLPSLYETGQWFGFKSWLDYQPTTADVGLWSTWPKAGLCLVTGDVCALDIDIKFAASDKSSQADSARKFIGRIRDAFASKLGQSHSLIPSRTRSNSTSCALFFRLAAPTTKRVLELLAPNVSGVRERCKIELLASGQQIVIAGEHATGVEVVCSLDRFDVNALPTATTGQIEDLLAELADCATEFGFDRCERVARATGQISSRTPEAAIKREIMRRRKEWLSDLLPFQQFDEEGEWRVSSLALERDLEEDLAIYPDGIHDFGAERSHSPVSFIREFGGINNDGSISFGGCPDYGPNGKEPFAVVGENDASVIRPTEAQAVSWLCQTLFGPYFPEQDNWRRALPKIAMALGLNWDALCHLQALQTFDRIEADGSVAPFNPTEWNAAELGHHAQLLPAMRAIDPEGFSLLEFAWNLSGAIGSDQQLHAVVDRQQSAQSEDATRTEYATSEAGSIEETSWTEPRDLFGDGNTARLLSLRRGCLPDVMEGYVRDVSARMGAPEAFAVGAALATVSGAAGSKWRIQPREHDTGWTEPAFLWFGIIEEPGGKKSPVISAFTSPLSKLDNEYASEDGRKHREWAERRTKRRKGDPDIGPEPVIRRKVVENFTMEALTHVLAGNPAGVLVRQDELTQLIGSMDAYKTNRGADRPMLLSLIDGRDMRVDRAGKGLAAVPCWGAAVIGGIQPRKISEMANNLDADGLLQRFIPIIGDGVRRRGVDSRPDRDAAAKYEVLVREIAAFEPVMPEAIRLSSEAHEVWRKLQDRIETLYELPNLSDAWKGHLGKWQGFSARLLLLLHLAEHWTADGGATIERIAVTADTARRASRLIEWLLSHAISFYERHVGAGEAGDDARWIAGHILAGDRRGLLTRRDIGQAKKEFRTHPDRVARAMRYLEAMEWCNPEVGRSDRYGASRWNINPAVFVLFKDRAEMERARRVDQRVKIAEAAAERRRLIAGGDDE